MSLRSSSSACPSGMDDRWMPPPSAARYHQRVVDLGVDEGDLESKPWSTRRWESSRSGVMTWPWHASAAPGRQDVALAHVSLTLRLSLLSVRTEEATWQTMHLHRWAEKTGYQRTRVENWRWQLPGRGPVAVARGEFPKPYRPPRDRNGTGRINCPGLIIQRIALILISIPAVQI